MICDHDRDRDHGDNDHDVRCHDDNDQDGNDQDNDYHGDIDHYSWSCDPVNDQ